MSGRRSSGEKNQSVPYASSDHRLEIRVAIIGALAAIVGALAGGLSTYLVADHSIDSKRDDDLRIERRDAYARYYSDAASFAAQITLQADRIIDARSSNPPNEEVLGRIRADFDDRRRTLHHDQAQVVLLGSEEVANAGFRLASKIEAMKNEISKDQPTIDDITASVKATADGLDEFSAAARKDLGIS
jgi:hypothetical protein